MVTAEQEEHGYDYGDKIGVTLEELSGAHACAIDRGDSRMSSNEHKSCGDHTTGRRRTRERNKSQGFGTTEFLRKHAKHKLTKELK